MLIAAVAWIEHHLAQHVQDVSAFGINHEARNATSLGAIQAVTLGDRTDGIRFFVVSLGSRLSDQIALVVPELNILFLVAHYLLNEQRGGELSEAFAHPLIAVRFPTDHVAPPLMR